MEKKNIEWKRQKKFEKGNIENVNFCDIDKKTRLGHVVEYNGFSHWYSVYCVGSTDGKLLTAIEPMVDGKFALAPVLDLRDNAYYNVKMMGSKERSKMLVGMYDVVGEYLDYFEKGPSKEEEIKTLRGIEACIDRLKKGKSTASDMRFFWGYEELH